MVLLCSLHHPHAHAKVKGIDSAAADEAPADRGADRAADRRDKVGNLICGWANHLEDGSPMKRARCRDGTGDRALRRQPSRS